MNESITDMDKFKVKIGARPVTLEDMKDPSIKASIINSLEYRVKQKISNLTIKSIFPPEIDELV